MTRLGLTDYEDQAPATALRRIIADDRYPLSPRVLTLKTILAKLRPEPAHDPLPPLKHDEPPRIGAKRRR